MIRYLVIIKFIALGLFSNLSYCGPYLNYQPKGKEVLIYHENKVAAYERRNLEIHFKDGLRKKAREGIDRGIPADSPAVVLDILPSVFRRMSQLDRYYRYPGSFFDSLTVNNVWSYSNGDIAIIQGSSVSSEGTTYGRFSLLYLPGNRLVHFVRTDEDMHMVFSEEVREFYVNVRSGNISHFKRDGTWKDVNGKKVGRFKKFGKSCMMETLMSLSLRDLGLVDELVAVMKAHRSSVPPLLKLVKDQYQYLHLENPLGEGQAR